ncbi:MAG: glycogen synthase GlgA [Anaerolineales bacterium]
MKSLKILFLSAEVQPFAKTGGLADVGGSLPKALRALGHDVRVVMPAYSTVEARRASLTMLPNVSVPVGTYPQPAGVFEGRLPESDVPIYFIAERNLFDRSQLYGYGDDAYRFAFFSRAALAFAEQIEWKPDVVHAHDWHTAPAVMWLDTGGRGSDFWRDTPSVFTIHNLAHQGRTDWGVLAYLRLESYRLNEEGYGEINWMARAIHHATLINTVSPTYAREILTPEGGAGLDGLLRYRQFDVHGILNGLDDDEWNPVTDARIPQRFDVEQISQRAANKRVLQQRAGLPVRDDIPLVAMVTRLDWQKGLDITGHVLHLLLNEYAGAAQFVALGTGDPRYEQMLAHLAGYHRNKMAAFLSYQADLSHLIYAGSDMFVMPSLFEPCGLGQLIAMRYGCVPVVRATGGLADTVQDGVTGFSFYNYDSQSFWQALQRALHVYRNDHASWWQIQRNGMLADFSWERSALGYQQLYSWGMARFGKSGD